jgi:4-amino-4-deoxy-L-arabinose transferase-like glycosyltransferase
MIGARIKNRLLFYSALIPFIISRIPNLHFAFYWDESWVYAPAAYLMYDHGPSLLPDAIPILFSRGHPLLFPALCAGWMKIFGRSNYAMHSFALFISVALAIVLYEVLLTLFNKKTALISAGLLLLNTYFLVQSTVVVTDIMIALFAFISLYCYIKEKYILAAVSLTLLVFTKESGLVAVAVIIADLFVLVLTKKITIKTALLKSTVVLFPVIILLLFFILQKKELGWYMYPGHTSAIIFTISNTFYNLQRSIGWLFGENLLFYSFLPLLFLSGFAAWKYKHIKYLWPVIAALIIYLHIAVFSFKDAVFYFSAFALLTLVGYLFLVPWKIFNRLQERFLRIIVLFCLAYLYFCCINFYEGRYLFPCFLIITFILIPVLYNYLIPETKNYLFAGVLIVIISIGVLINIYPDKQGIVGSLDRIYVQQEVVNYLEQNNYYDYSIACSSFLEQVHLKDPKTGFLSSQRSFSNVKDKIDSTTKLVIFDNIECDDSYLNFKFNPGFTLINQFVKDSAWVEVYARK